MSTPPSRRRRISSVVTVRRAQSERRYLSPWQAAHAAQHARFWHPMPHPGKAMAPPGYLQPLLPPSSGWARMDRVEHRVDHHHHAPRMAIIPPPVPRPQQPHMVGKSQLVLSSDLWGSLRKRQGLPFMSPAQLPPLALGSPPPGMAMPPVILPPGNLQEKLSHDRLAAFLAVETPSYQPRSILSCPESPLYESLVSTFSNLEDEVNFQDTDADHEYQQIPLLTTVDKLPQNNTEPSKDIATPPLKNEETDIIPELQSEYQTVTDAKITTLDVRPEKNMGKENDLEVAVETQVCSCQSGKMSDKGSGIVSPISQKTDSSSQTVSPAGKFHKSTVYIKDDEKDSSIETLSTLSDSDTYQDLERPPTVIYLASSRNLSTSRDNLSNKTDETEPTEVKRKTNFCNQNKLVNRPKSTQRNQFFSVTTSLNSKSPQLSKPVTNNLNNPSTCQRKTSIRLPESSCLSLTIELPETKENSWKPSQRSKGNQELDSQVPHIITTLDPPIRNKNILDWASENSDIPPLVVNFDSESEDDLAMDTNLSSTTLDDSSTSIYVTEDDTTSLYSSIAELYSVIPGDPDSLVYVYRAIPNNTNYNTRLIHHSSSAGLQVPSYILNRIDDCSTCSSVSSDSDDMWNDTISFVEPTYKPTNLSVGSRGHLKIDYSWSWNSLDDFVRTRSPREGSIDDRIGSPRRSVYSNKSSQGMSS